MTSIPLEASRLKLWRAKEHISSLESEIAAYMARKPAHANIRPAIPPKDAGMVYHEIVVTEPIPIHLSTIVGDIVHNLRTSLDLLASQLVRDAGGDDANVHFPFARSADELEKAIKRRGCDRLREEVQNLMRAQKPYLNEGNATLRGVHDLDVADKHRTLILTHGRIQIPHSDGEPIIPSSGVYFDRRAKDGSERVGILTRGHIRANNWPMGEGLPVTFDLTFPQGGPFAAQSLLPFCKSFEQEFSGVVDAFELLCFGTVTKRFPWA